jgi:hypothetical protein
VDLGVVDTHTLVNTVTSAPMRSARSTKPCRATVPPPDPGLTTIDAVRMVRPASGRASAGRFVSEGWAAVRPA